MEKKIIGRCPLCGGNVVKTCKGYRCENNIAEQPTCVLNINGIIGNRKMSDEEITELLERRFILLDGFASKEGKAFPSVLELADNGAINMQSVIGNVRIAAVIFGWVHAPSTAPITATSKRRATSPSGATSVVTS